MLDIDPSDCRLEIGIGRKFLRSLVWHFSRFLRRQLPQKCGALSPGADAIDREARRLANHFVTDMQEYFQRTLSESYEGLDNLSPEGIVDLYVRENLADFEADYLKDQLPGFRLASGQPPAIPHPERVPSLTLQACH